jgi:hypothetical protein
MGSIGQPRLAHQYRDHHKSLLSSVVSRCEIHEVEWAAEKVSAINMGRLKATKYQVPRLPILHNICLHHHLPLKGMLNRRQERTPLDPC